MLSRSQHCQHLPQQTVLEFSTCLHKSNSQRCGARVADVGYFSSFTAVISALCPLQGSSLSLADLQALPTVTDLKMPPVALVLLCAQAGESQVFPFGHLSACHLTLTVNMLCLFSAFSLDNQGPSKSSQNTEGKSLPLGTVGTTHRQPG